MGLEIHTITPDVCCQHHTMNLQLMSKHKNYSTVCLCCSQPPQPNTRQLKLCVDICVLVLSNQLCPASPSSSKVSRTSVCACVCVQAATFTNSYLWKEASLPVTGSLQMNRASAYKARAILLFPPALLQAVSHTSLQALKYQHTQVNSCVSEENKSKTNIS